MPKNDQLTFFELMRRWEGACADSIQTPWCGCGSPEMAYAFIRDALTAHQQGCPAQPEFWHQLPRGAGDILSGVLHQLVLLEHGGSWIAAWLTPFGAQVHALLSAMTDAEIGTAYDANAGATRCYCCPGPCPHCGATTP